MTCVAGHQPNLYPYGGFFAKAATVDTFVIVDTTQYVKKEYHNRNRIKLLDGKIHWLTIPVKNSGRYMQKINEVEIDSSKDWRRIHRKTIIANYGKSPHFNDFFPQFDEMLSRDWCLLADYNVCFIKEVFRFLGIKVPLLTSSELKISGKATELILDICRKTGASSYLHGKHSRDYVDFYMLDSAGIKNLIQDFSCEEYPQTTMPFSPNLSMLDILFNCGKDAHQLLIDGNKIISL